VPQQAELFEKASLFCASISRLEGILSKEAETLKEAQQ
jgi:hypothetical protein